MTRDDVVLLLLHFAGNNGFTPVQLQKAAFLASDRGPSLFDEGSTFNFKPYDYGPFDKNVYRSVEELERRGLVATLVSSSRRWKDNFITDDGNTRAVQLLNSLDEEEKGFIKEVSDYVTSLSFSDLVSAIYEEYPEMKENSVFQG